MAKETLSQDSKDLYFIFSYLLIWISGIIVYETQGQIDKRIKFHSLQSIFLGIVITATLLTQLTMLFGALLWLYGIYIGIKAHTGDDVSIPMIGDYVSNYMKR